MHVTIDGFGGDPARLSDLQLVRGVFDLCRKEMGLEPVVDILIFPYSGINPKDSGISGFALLEAGHLTIHTFTNHGQIWIDYFGDQVFDGLKIKRRIENEFGITNTRVHNLPRGREYSIPGDQAPTRAGTV